jgi:hypothetical protein
MLHTPVPEPSSWPRHLPIEHRAARHADGGQVDAGRAHQQRRRGLVAAHEQHHAVDRVAADRFLDVHAREVAIQHGGGPQQRLAERHHRELQREAAGFVDADLHLLGERAEVRVAGREFAEGVADADDGAAVELVVRHALALDPAAVGEAVAVLAAEPLLAAQFAGLLLGRRRHRVSPESVNHRIMVIRLRAHRTNHERTFRPLPRPSVLAVMKLPPFYLEPLRATSRCTTACTKPIRKPSRVAPTIRASPAAASRKVPRALMEQLPALEIVSIMGVGYDKVDVRPPSSAACRSRTRPTCSTTKWPTSRWA